MRHRGRVVHPIVNVRRKMRRRIGLEGAARGGVEDGFTLIEMVIVVAILPIVVGAIAVALLSVFGLQGGVQSRIGDSNDALVSATTFNRDVQSAQEIETTTAPACGTAGQTQLVGLEWGLDSAGNYQTVVSYVFVPTDHGLASPGHEQARPPGLLCSPLSPFERSDGHPHGLP